MKNDIDYDAFVICNAEGTDLDFVNRLVDTLQAPPYKLKLCAPWRESACFNQNVREFIQYRYCNIFKNYEVLLLVENVSEYLLEELTIYQNKSTAITIKNERLVLI